MDVASQKARIRTAIKAQRHQLSNQVWKEKSESVIKLLKELEAFKEAQVIHCFVSMNDRKEVNTHSLIEFLLNQQKTVVVPRTNFESNHIDHIELTSMEQLVQNKWGVLEPEINDPNRFEDEVDVILLPLLAADKSFNRLGYGKGFYDRFLKKTKAIKIGLVFEDFIIDEIPVEDFDEKLDILVSDKKYYIRNN